MSEQSLQILESIKARLKRTARRRHVTHMAFGGVLLLGVISGLWLLFTAIEAGFWLTTTSRQFALLFILLLSGLVLGWFVVVPMLRALGVLGIKGEDALAKDIGYSFPQISDRLINLLHLAEGKRSMAAPAFVDHAVQTLNQDIEQVEFEKMDGFGKAYQATRYAVIPVAGILLFMLTAPGSFLDASQRLLDPTTEFLRPSPFQMNVTPGSVELLRGDSLHVEVTLSGSELPNTLTLRYQNEGENKIIEEELLPDSSGTYSRTFYNVRRPFSYNLTAQSVLTSWYSVDIVERPIIRSLQVSLNFPRYSRIPPQRLDPNVGDVQALPGTSVKVETIVGGPNLEEGFIVFDDGRQDTLAIEGGMASGTFTLTREGTYRILMRDSKGTTNSNPIRYSMKLLQDAYPTVVLLSPGPITELNEALTVPLRSRITDDFGFRQLRLYYRLSESRFGPGMPSFESIDVPLGNLSELDQESNFEWLISEMTELDPVPGDVIEYYIQVWDNDSFSGYKSAKSSTQVLRLPSLAEQYNAIEEKENSVQEELEDLINETDGVKEKFNELQDELRNKLESDWEDERQLEQLIEKQEELESRVEDISQSFEDMTQQMEDNNLFSEETQELYEEMQQVLEEINSPELMNALQELQQAMQELNLQQMQESLNNFQFNEDQYKQRLERTLELFKKLRVQQDLEEIARRAEALAKQQEQLQEETEKLEQEEDSSPDSEADEQSPSDEETAGQDSSDEEPANDDSANNDPSTDEPAPEGDNSQESEAGEQNQEQSATPQENQEGGNQEQNSSNDGSEQEEVSRQEDLARQQELSKEEMQELEEKLEEILERMKETESTPSDQMQELNDQVQDQQLPEQMQDNADQIRQNELNQAQQQQQQMQQQLQQMQQQLQQMQENMQGAQMQLNLSGLRRALSDILTLSQLQEQLRENVRSLSADSPTLRQLTQDQVELGSGLRVVSDSLQELSKKIPQMSREVQQHAGDALREMNFAVESMTDRIGNRATGYQKESMMHLNELALLLSDLLNEMMNMQGGGGGGMSMQQMIEQLQNAAGQQQKLNQQIQQLLNEAQGNRMSQDMQNRLRQMAAQQEQIRSQIKQLSRNRELRRELMGDLNRVAEQMEETIRELQRNRPGRQTLERQQQILTRLLESTKSLQERGREKRREGQIGEEFYRESPDAIPPSEEADRLRRALIEALESGYSPDYEELIKRYFELLQERSLEEVQ